MGLAPRRSEAQRHLPRAAVYDPDALYDSSDADATDAGTTECSTAETDSEESQSESNELATKNLKDGRHNAVSRSLHNNSKYVSERPMSAHNAAVTPGTHGPSTHHVNGDTEPKNEGPWASPLFLLVAFFGIVIVAGALFYMIYTR